MGDARWCALWVVLIAICFAQVEMALNACALATVLWRVYISGVCNYGGSTRSCVEEITPNLQRVL